MKAVLRPIAAFFGFNLLGLVIGVLVGGMVFGLSFLLLGLAEPLMMLEWDSVLFTALFVLYGVLVFTDNNMRDRIETRLD